MIKLNLDFRSCLGKVSNLRLTYSLQDEIELRRLRTENRLLRQRIDLLENESSELADKLIQVIIGGQYEIMMVVIVMMEMMLMMVMEKRIDLLENESRELAKKVIHVNLL